MAGLGATACGGTGSHRLRPRRWRDFMTPPSAGLWRDWEPRFVTLRGVNSGEKGENGKGPDARSGLSPPPASCGIKTFEGRGLTE